MKRVRTLYYMLFSVCTLLLALVFSASAQDVPTNLYLSAVDTSEFPKVNVYLVATNANGGRFPALFVDALQVMEDASPRTASMYDSPRGTAVTFVIDADQVAADNWEAIRTAIESYVSLDEAWMDEDYDTASVIVANGASWTPLVEDTPFRNEVFNAFIDASGQYYVPDPLPLTPLNDLIEFGLNSLPAKTSTPGMYRAMVVFSSGDAGGSNASMESVAALAREKHVSLFTVQVGDNPGAAGILGALADNSNGKSYGLDEQLVPLWQLISSHRQQYTISYLSQIRASGPHTVQVQLSETVNDSLTFDITVLDPAVEITLPEPNAIIQRSPAESSDDPTTFEPQSQSIKYLWSFPDGHERAVNMVQLRVNGAVQKQLDLTAVDDRNLVWDIAALEPGAYSLRVEVIDELGLEGQSAEIPVTIAFDTGEATPAAEEASETEATATPDSGQTGDESSVFQTAWNTVRQHLGCVGVSGLSLSALLLMAFTFRRRLGGLMKSPISVLRRMPFMRPLDGVLHNIERVTGSVDLKGAKDKVAEKAPRRGKKGAEQEAPAAAAGPQPIPRGVGYIELAVGPQELAGRPIPVRGELKLGRSADHAQVVIHDATVSRLHCSVMPEYGQTYRVFNHSSQQTWVNEQRVPEYGLLLEDGDEIRMGKVRFRFHLKGR